MKNTVFYKLERQSADYALKLQATDGAMLPSHRRGMEEKNSQCGGFRNKPNHNRAWQEGAPVPSRKTET